MNYAHNKNDMICYDKNHKLVAILSKENVIIEQVVCTKEHLELKVHFDTMFFDQLKKIELNCNGESSFYEIEGPDMVFNVDRSYDACDEIAIFFHGEHSKTKMLLSDTLQKKKEVLKGTLVANKGKKGLRITRIKNPLRRLKLAVVNL